MDMISSTTSNTAAQSAEQNEQEASMVATPPSEAAATARDNNANQLAWQQQVLASGGGERKPRPLQEQGLICPRCNSTNTKFCYYNNNSMTQPRYFCKGCRRNWTQGGILRNVPMGGRSRKNKQNRAGSSSAAAPPAAPSSSSNDSKKMNLTQQLLMMPTATAPMPADFPHVLPSFMSMGGGFELPSSDHHSLPFPPLCPLFNPGMTLLESLTEGFLDSGNNGMAAQPLFGTSDPQMLGLLQGVDQVLELPMAAAGGSGLQQRPSLAAQEQQVVGDDGNADNNNNTNTTTINNNNTGGGASGGSSDIEYY